MRLMFPQILPFLGLLLAASALCPAVMAQPDQAPRNFIPPVTSPPISFDQLKELIGGPSLITFSGKNVSSADLSKLFFPDSNPPTLSAAQAQLNGFHPQVDVNWKEVPFWTAARESEKLTGLHWDTLQGLDRGLVVETYGGLGDFDGTVAADTPFVKVCLNSISHQGRSTILMKGGKEAVPNSSNWTQLRLSTYLDPKLPLLSGTVRVYQVQTGTGEIQAGVPKNPWDSSGHVFLRPSVQDVTLQPTLTSGTLLRLIKGTVNMDLVTASQPFKVADLEKSAGFSQTAGPKKITIKSVAIDANWAKFQIEALSPPKIIMDPYANGGFFDRATDKFLLFHLRDANGREMRGGATRIQGGGLGGQEQTIGDFQFATQDARGEKFKAPFSLEWDIPTETRSFEVPFELHDIIVP